MHSVRADILVAAKREVSLMISQGRLLSPRDAWLMSGHMKEQQTLWSVAYRIATRHDCSAEEVNRYLEHHFPQYAGGAHPVDWHEMEHRDAHHERRPH